MRRTIVVFCLTLYIGCDVTLAQQPKVAAKAKADVAAKVDTSRGDKMLADYFAAETKKLQDACLADIKTLDDWKSKRGEYRRQLLEMLGLDPLPEKTDLKPVITGRLEQEDFVVEKLHFESRPGLYVTGNLYLPKKIEKPLPTILYVCGHSVVKVNDVAMGAKAGYQHHGAWYARNGYACLTIDTLQLGEIEGIHHGTHRYGMWWWLNRGYTPAGVEAWNCVRALDYLETRPEVDKTRFGVTGRSGGGAYSWWIAAIDERIKVAVPTAGTTDLQNHVVDGCVEGHCDCMFMVNTYRWDYPQVAALVAPRPLLISNTDSDGIFPLDGVVRTFDKVRRIYRLYDKEKKGTGEDVALNISPGPHKDTQELNTHEFRWFNHYLKGDDSPIDTRAPKYFQPEELKVFGKLPEDEVNTKVHETFVGKPEISVPADQRQWEKQRDQWRSELSQKAFRGWPSVEEPLDIKQVFSCDVDGVHLSGYEFTSQAPFRLRLYVLHKSGLTQPTFNFINIAADNEKWTNFLADVRKGFANELADEHLPQSSENGWKTVQSLVQKSYTITFVVPRGIGMSSFNTEEKKQVQNRRRFYLLGQTLEQMQSWDIRRGIQAAEKISPVSGGKFVVRSHGPTSILGLHAALLEPSVRGLELNNPTKTYREGPYFLNVERYFDIPQAVAMATEQARVVIHQDDDKGWEYLQATAKALNWSEERISIRGKPVEK